MSSLKNAEVNKALKENENKMTLRFNTCLILIKDVELVVKSAKNTWKKIYHLHKPSEHLVEIKDDDDEKDQEDYDKSI